MSALLNNLLLRYRMVLFPNIGTTLQVLISTVFFFCVRSGLFVTLHRFLALQQNAVFQAVGQPEGCISQFSEE